MVLKTTNGGAHLGRHQPDLSRASYDVPASVASYGEAAQKQATRRGVVYALGPSRAT